MSLAMAQVEIILTFWFGEIVKEVPLKPRKIWFTKNPAFDQAVHQFRSTYEQAAGGQLDGWVAFPQGSLALVLLLDQFPRHLFRGQPQAFATDAQAVSVAQAAIAQGFDQQFPSVQRQFFYFPLEHSENLEHQNQAVSLFRAFSNDSDLRDSYDYAIRHREVIRRFGRFPHRNQILGRDSTPEEVDFLKQPGSSF